MTLFETIRIETCRDCRHVSHTGGFTKGGAKPCCDHDETVTLRGNDCFKRIIKDIKKIPGWCPFRPKIVKNPYPKLPKGYAVITSYSNEKMAMVGVFDFLLMTEECPATMTYDGKQYKCGPLAPIPDIMMGAICSMREYELVTKDDT